MSSLKSVKPCNKVCPGFLTSRGEHKHLRPKRAKSEKDTIKKVFTIRSDKDGSKDSLPFLRKPTRGTFEIHIANIQLTDSCLKYMIDQLGKHSEVLVSWKFMDHDKNSTPPEPCRGTRIEIDTIYNYKIDVETTFVEYLRRKKLGVELYASSKQKQLCIGKGRAGLECIINNPQQKHRVRVELFDYYKARAAGNKPKAAARLELYFKISCDYGLFDKLARRTSVEQPRSVAQDLVNIRSLFEIVTHEREVGEIGSKTILPTESEINNFEEALDLVLTRNKALRTTQSEITIELKERTQWLREEADWRRTLQEHAILRGKDPNEIRWRQWRDEFTANVSIRTYLDFPPTYKAELTITLARMILFDDSAPMVNENMTQFYIEYTFLGYEGPLMETPDSLPKNGSSFDYEFVKKFPISLIADHDHCNELAQFIKNGEYLVFNVISEPEEDETVPIQTCQLIGFCKVSMFEVAQLETNTAAYWFDIVNCTDTEQVIGYLKVQIDGIQAMRRMALKILAPRSYDIIQ